MITSRLILALSTSLGGVCAHVVAERAPMITAAAVIPRQVDNPQGFVGYYSSSGALAWQTAECLAGRTFTTSASYGVCCDTALGACGRNDFATACSGVYAMYGDGPYSCTYTCNTDFVLKTANDANPILWVGCDTDGVQTNFYASMPASNSAARTTIPSSPSTTDPSSAQTTVTVPPGGQSTTPTLTPTPTPQKSSSKVWIAGVIVGPLAAIAIAGLLIWVFCLKKKKKNQVSLPAPMQQAPGQYIHPPPGADQRYSQPAPQYTTAPYQPPSPSPGPPQQWAPVPSPTPVPVSPLSVNGPFMPEKNSPAHQDQQHAFDAKTPKSPVPTVSEVASPQTYASQTQPPSGTVSEMGSPQPHSAQPLPPSNYAAQAGPVPTHLPPTHASELQ